MPPGRGRGSLLGRLPRILNCVWEERSVTRGCLHGGSGHSLHARWQASGSDSPGHRPSHPEGPELQPRTGGGGSWPGRAAQRSPPGDSPQEQSRPQPPLDPQSNLLLLRYAFKAGGAGDGGALLESSGLPPLAAGRYKGRAAPPPGLLGSLLSRQLSSKAAGRRHPGATATAAPRRSDTSGYISPPPAGRQLGDGNGASAAGGVEGELQANRFDRSKRFWEAAASEPSMVGGEVEVQELHKLEGWRHIPLKESVGHTKLEVLVGAAAGVLLATWIEQVGLFRA